MSGFEVVGIVLALFPIVVDGVRTYKQVRSGESLKYLIKEIFAEQVLFRNSIGQLLMPTVPIAAFKQMLDPDSHKFGRWQDVSLQSRIESSFGITNSAYLLMTLGDIQKELIEIKEVLSYVTKPASDKIGSRFSYNLQTMRHTREGSTVRERLRRLQKFNAKLAQVFVAPRASVTMQSGASLDWLPSLSGYEHLTNVYHALQKSYQCPCTGAHLTKIRLPALKASTQQSGSGARVVTNLLFAIDNYDTDEDSMPPLPRIESLGSPTASTSSLVSTLRPGDETGTETSVPPLGRASSSELSQSLSELSMVGSNISTNTTMSRPSNLRGCSVSVVKCTDPNVEQIVDLCDSIRTVEGITTARGGSKSIGSLPPVGDHSYELLSDQQDLRSTIDSMTSLEDIFTSTHHKLGRGLRIELAVRLSTAVLQLCMTPWLASAWSWSDFSVTALQGGRLDSLSLFLAHEFHSRRGNALQATKSNQNRAVMMLSPGEPALTRLGFALIELAFGKRLASMQGQGQNTDGDAYYRDLAIAADLLNSGQLLQEEGLRYHQAVLTCLKQEIRSQDGYGKKSLHLQDPSFQQDAASTILRPLVGLWTADFGGGVEQTG